MPEPLSVGDIHRSLKLQADCSQKIYQAVVDLANIAEKLEVDNTSKVEFEKLMGQLIKVGDELSSNAEKTSERVLGALEPAG